MAASQVRVCAGCADPQVNLPMHFLVCVVLALAAMASPSVAQTEMPAAQTHVDTVPWEPGPGRLPQIDPVQVQLDAASIERFLASLPTLISLARDLDGESGRKEILKLEDNLAFLLLPHLFAPETRERIDQTLEGLGFAAYADWADVAYSISLAVQATEFTGALNLGSQEQAALRDIENNPALSGEQKAKKLDEMKSQFAALAEFEPLPGNREAVAPYLERLRAATKG
jgi:hypothetical protein